MKNTIRRKQTTIRQIAEAADVSLSTVSRALRRDPKANKETTERVLGIARDLNYYPDSLAKGLRQSKTDTIGIILNDLNNPFYAEILSGIGEMVNRSNHSLLISYSHYDPEQERKNIMMMFSKRVDGIILSPIDDATGNIGLLREAGVPFVLIDCFPTFPDVNYVYSEHGTGATMATEHLINRGHRNILLMTGPPGRCMASHFVDGYRGALGSHNIPVREELLVHAEDLSIESGYRTFKDLLSGGGNRSDLEFSAVVTISDLLAIGIYRAAQELQFKIPDDYSVVGYDNIELSSVLNPPLTTIDQPRRQIGVESLSLLMGLITSGSGERRCVAFPPCLVKRGSVRNVAR